MLSVLMPVYNVEKYLQKTLDCVAAQTFTDFEVIMVDDGSTDQSGAICDAFCEKDKRFRVIHTPNAGVSAARNRCLQEAKGEYLYFMDSDDLILPESFEELFAALFAHQADMSAGNVFYTDNQGNPLDHLNMHCPVKDEIITGEEYLRKLCEPYSNFYCTLWNKIYKREVFDGINFPVGKINEDEARIHEIIYNCKKIVISRKCYYTYIKHPASITGSQFSLKNLDREDAFIERALFFEKHALPELAQMTALNALDSAIVTFAKCVRGGMYYGKVKARLHEDFDFFFSRARQVKNINLKQRKVLTIGWVVLHFPDIYAKYVEFLAKVSDMGFGQAFKDEVYNFILACFACLPTKDVIVFESHPEMACNTYPVYRYLLEKGLNEKYTFVWLTERKARYQNFPEKNVRFLTDAPHARTVLEKLKYMKTIATARGLVYSNRLLGVYGKDRLSLCLEHGMPLKRSNGTYCINNRCTASLCESEFFADVFSEDFRVDKDKLIYMGFPRNDLLLRENSSLQKFGFAGYDKVIFWLPTFRQRNVAAKNKRVSDYEMTVHGTGLPTLETQEDLQKVNDFLAKQNCLLLIKPHPSQDLSAMAAIDLSHIVLLNDELLREKGVQLYELLGRCDALITDYSSVYYDFLLCDKPIGLTIDDLAEYTAKRGFVFKDPLEILKGEHLSTVDDLLTFLAHVKHGEDVTGAERRAVMHKIHTITDGSSAQRVGDYIIEQLERMKK